MYRTTLRGVVVCTERFLAIPSRLLRTQMAGFVLQDPSSGNGQVHKVE